MTNVILVAHILVSIVLIIVVLMQRSEGGALGIGGGGGGGGAGGGLMSGRGVAGALVRTTMIFGAIFFITSLGLTTLATRNSDGRTNIERSLDEEFQPSTVDDELGLGDVEDILSIDGSLIDDPLAAEPTSPVTPPVASEPETDAVADDPLADPVENEPQP